MKQRAWRRARWWWSPSSVCDVPLPIPKKQGRKVLWKLSAIWKYIIWDTKEKKIITFALYPLYSHGGKWYNLKSLFLVLFFCLFSLAKVEQSDKSEVADNRILKEASNNDIFCLYMTQCAILLPVAMGWEGLLGLSERCPGCCTAAGGLSGVGGTA